MTTKLRPELETVLRGLLTASEQTQRLALDQVGDALGVLSVSTDEIDALLSALEACGREITSPQGGSGEGHLQRVVSAARELKQRHGRRPSLTEVAEHAQLTREQVLGALALLRIMQR